MPDGNSSGVLRLFVALDPPATVRDALGTLPGRLRGVTWTPPHQYHVTLRFLGEVAAEARAGIETALSAIAVESFVLPVEGTGAFPPQRPPRVLWVGTGTGHPRLFQLRQRVDDALLRCGLDLDVRTFHPHITLGRCSAAVSPGAVRQFLHDHAAFVAPAFRVGHFSLYQSTLGPGGAVHRELLRVPLVNPAA